MLSKRLPFAICNKIAAGEVMPYAVLHFPGSSSWTGEVRGRVKEWVKMGVGGWRIGSRKTAGTLLSGFHRMERLKYLDTAETGRALEKAGKLGRMLRGGKVDDKGKG